MRKELHKKGNEERMSPLSGEETDKKVWHCLSVKETYHYWAILINELLNMFKIMNFFLSEY